MTPRSPQPPAALAETPRGRFVRSRFRRTLVSVLGVQVVTLVLLWLLQVHYSRAG